MAVVAIRNCLLLAHGREHSEDFIVKNIALLYTTFLHGWSQSGVNIMRKRIAVVAVILLGVGLCLWLFANKRHTPSSASGVRPVARVSDSLGAAGAPREPAKAVVAPIPALTAEDDAPGSIKGLVLRPDGKPAAGARVGARWRQSERQPEMETGAALSGANQSRSAETDSAGHFEITGLLLGWAVVTAEHESGRAVERLHIDARQPHQEIALNLAAGESLAGVVVDGGGRGIGGARVVPLEHEGQKQFKYQSEAGAVLADESGQFRLLGLRPGEWTLYVSAEGYGPVIVGPFPAGIDNVRVLLGNGVDLDCHVQLLADNSPVEGVTVRLAYEDRALYPMEVASGPDGIARFPGLGKGGYRADVRHGHYALVGDAPLVAIDPARKPDPLVIVVAEGGRVMGRVRDGDSGEGIAGVVIGANREGGSPYYADPTRPDGTYEIFGLPAGNYEISIQDRVPGYPQELPRPAGRRLTVGAEGVLDGVDFELTRGAILAGIVRDTEGLPVAGVTVLARNVEGRQNLADYHTGEDGRFVFGAYAAGEEVRLSAERGPARSGLLGPFAAGAPGSDAIAIVLERDCTGIIAGTVVNTSGQPIECQVSAKATDPKMQFPVTAPACATDGFGNFVLADVCPGEYVVGIYKEGNHPQEAQKVRLDAGESVTGLKLIYDEGALYAISGFVTDEQGNPVEGAHVQARAVFSEPLHIPEQSTDATGAFQFDGLPQGEYMLGAQARGLEGDGFVTTSAGATDVVLALGTQRFLSGQVKDDRGAPVSGYSVTVVSEENPDAASTSDIADPTGRFRIPAPPSGNWRLQFDAPSYSPTEIEIAGDALVDGDYDIEVVLKPATP